MFDIENIRMDFPILNREVHGKKLVYLDNAATTQVPRQVAEAITEHYYNDNANIHRGIHYLSEISSQKYEDARKKVRNFINAESESEIAFTCGTTSSINTVASGFCDAFIQEGDEIIVSQLEHHSNFVPWQNVCRKKNAVLRILPAENGEIDISDFQRLLNERTKIVALTQVSNVTGTVTPVEEIIKISKDAGVPVLIDGAQGIRHEKVDVQELGCDFYCFSGHKMMGPTGIGVLYAKEKWMEQMEPVTSGGGMVDKVTADYTSYNTHPHKFESGTPNYVGAIALGKAIDYLNSVGRQDIADYEAELLAYTEERLKQFPELTILGRPSGRAGVISFSVEGVHPYDIASMLDKFGIAVRSGSLCAQPLLQTFALDSVVRVSPAFYNTFAETDSLMEALHKSCSLLQKWVKR